KTVSSTVRRSRVSVRSSTSRKVWELEFVYGDERCKGPRKESDKAFLEDHRTGLHSRRIRRRSFRNRNLCDCRRFARLCDSLDRHRLHPHDDRSPVYLRKDRDGEWAGTRGSYSQILSAMAPL